MNFNENTNIRIRAKRASNSMTFNHTFHDVKFWKSEFKFRKRIRELRKFVKIKISEECSKKEIRLFSNVHNRDFRADFWNFREFSKVSFFSRDIFLRFMKTTGIEKEHKTRLILLKLDKTSLSGLGTVQKNFIQILIL